MADVWTIDASPVAPTPATPARPRGERGRFTRTADVATLLLAGLGLPAAAHGLLNGWDGYPHWLRVADGVAGTIALLAVFLRRR